jgi:hypothetical protein
LNAFLRIDNLLVPLNQVTLNSSTDRIELEFSVMNSRHPAGPFRIQSSLTYTRLADEVALDGEVTEFPSFESYHYSAGKVCTLATTSQTHVMALQGATTGMSGRC